MTDSSNPLLAGLKLPGRIFPLPSRGIFYKNGELDPSVQNGEVHVQPMSALDEINMKNPDQLFSGAAVNEVFKTCVKGIAKPSELLSKDVDAIMLFLRTVTYGPSYDFVAKHTCESAQETKFTCNIDELISNMKLIDPTIVNQLYTVLLSNGQTVKLKPSKYQQVLDLIKANEAKKEITVEDQKANLVMMLLGVIDSVNDITDRNLITEWIKKIPSPIINRITERIESVNDWGSSLKWQCACKQCNQQFTVEIPINPISFFIE